MPLENSLAIILRSDLSLTAGAGILVDINLVITCAHVVNLALGRDMHATGRPAGKIQLKFHILPQVKFNAEIDSGSDAWRDPPASRAVGADLCLLRLSPGPFSPASPAEVWIYEGALPQQFRAAGFPENWQGDLDFADGDLLGSDEHGLFLLRSHVERLAVTKPSLFGDRRRTAGVIHSGFSGGPVEVGGRIVGLIAAARAPVEDATAYMISVEAFPHCIPRRTLWVDIVRRSREQVSRFFPKLPSSIPSPELFLREAYLHRSSESQLNDLLACDRAGLIIVGDSGSGKTSMLWRWSQDSLAAGHAVLLYRCGTLLTQNVDEEICRDLNFSDAQTLFHSLRSLRRPQGEEDRRLIIIFDAINEFRGEADAEPRDLLKHLDFVIRGLSGSGIHVVMSCSLAAWKRLERLNVVKNLTWSCYQPSDPVILNFFSDEEAEKAYDGYNKVLGKGSSWMSLPSDVRRRLRSPALLQVLALSYRYRSIPNDANTLQIYLQYYEERVQRQSERSFMDELAIEMLRQGRSTLVISGPNVAQSLRSRFEDEHPDAVYQSLKEKGILTELEPMPRSLDPESMSRRVEFTHSQIATYALSRALAIWENSSLRQRLKDLVSYADSFPLGWDVAKLFIRLRKDFGVLLDFIGSIDPESRELAVETLVDLHEDDAQTAFLWIRQLCASDVEEQRRTGLKAAYYIGPDARDLFIWAATEGSPDLRQATRDVLYLAWRRGTLSSREGTLALAYLLWRMDPPFTYNLLRDLLTKLRLGNREVFEFILRLSITIYINHCERQDVIDWTTQLYDSLASKLHLHLIRTDLFGKKFERFLFGGVAAGFALPILKAASQADEQTIDAFFQLSHAERACLQRLSTYLDPVSDLSSARDDLMEMLKSNLPTFNIAASLVVGVHAYARFSSSEQFVKDLFQSCSWRGRVWILLAFSVLLPDTPQEWIPLLELFTTTIFSEGSLTSVDFLPLVENVELLPTPLGLAYAKAGDSMPAFLSIICAARGGSISSRSQHSSLGRCLNGLGAVGIHYPQAVLALFREFVLLGDTDVWDLLLTPLSIMRSLHLDDVDSFILDCKQGFAYQRRVAARSNVELINRYIQTLGFYNNAVHFSAKYPRMRLPLSVGAFNLLATAKSAKEFLAEYTMTAFRLFRSAKFHLKEWTLTDE